MIGDCASWKVKYDVCTQVLPTLSPQPLPHFPFSRCEILAQTFLNSQPGPMVKIPISQHFRLRTCCHVKYTHECFVKQFAHDVFESACTTAVSVARDAACDRGSLHGRTFQCFTRPGSRTARARARSLSSHMFVARSHPKLYSFSFKPGRSPICSQSTPTVVLLTHVTFNMQIPVIIELKRIVLTRNRVHPRSFRMIKVSDSTSKM